ncbi:kinase domain-containing protein [Diaporthe sp. PMI_573]|nr:kinase domain-containing protein [Diaporthaceae sp. PMI_573]
MSLIMIEKTKSIIKLLEEDVNDSDLPLIKVPRSNGENLFDLRVKRDPNKNLSCFQKKWNQLNIRNFEEWQWATLPVEFSRPTEEGEVKHDRFEEQRVLPFIKDSREHKPHFSRRTELEGGFASVFRVGIHPKHHNFHTSQDRTDNAYFAVKRLHSQSEDAFKREVEMLNKFSSNRHEHLISLLATYEQFDRFFLVFDWAEADLQRYWRKVNHTPSFDLNTVLWMIRQCKGIANGIIKIHEHQSTYAKIDSRSRGENKNVVFGHHGDIKPENVLWFAEPGEEGSNVGGTLKLSDFGLAELSVHQTISMAPKSKWGVSLAYRAPEADLKQGAAIGRSYDIWTLGCLYLEFITWMLGGKKLLDEFLEARKARDAMWHDIETHTFFELKIDSKTGEKMAIIKPAVKQFIRELHSHPKCSQLIHNFLDLVESSLLVVKTNDRQRIDRISIKQVHQELSTMLKSCESYDYVISPVSL